MTVQPGQKITSLPAQTDDALMAIDTGGPVLASIPVGGGTFILNGATPVTVADDRVTANSIICISLKTVGGTVSPTCPNILTITPGTGFTVGGVALDVSTYNYCILG
jgi:hypothetical protein